MMQLWYSFASQKLGEGVAGRFVGLLEIGEMGAYPHDEGQKPVLKERPRMSF